MCLDRPPKEMNRWVKAQRFISERGVVWLAPVAWGRVRLAPEASTYIVEHRFFCVKQSTNILHSAGNSWEYVDCVKRAFGAGSGKGGGECAATVVAADVLGRKQRAEDVEASRRSPNSGQPRMTLTSAPADRTIRNSKWYRQLKHETFRHQWWLSPPVVSIRFR